MSSPRPAARPLSLDLRTFGDSPAAIYLAQVLNQRQDVVAARKVSRALAQGRELLAAVARAHLEHDALDTKTFARLLPLMSAHLRQSVRTCLAGHDEHVRNLAVNVTEGAVKTWKRRVEHARRLEKTRARHNNGRVEYLLAAPVPGEVTPQVLQQRSKRYLARKGKQDTLY